MKKSLFLKKTPFLSQISFMIERQITFQDKHPNFQESLERLKINRHPISILCDHLEDVQNIGGLFRLADAANLEEIIFFQEKPLDITKRLKRIARQTIEYIPHRVISNLADLDFEGKQIIALELTNQSIPYTQFVLNKPLILILGNERFGVSDKLLNLAEQSIHLPMYGIKNSMNVTNAAGIAVYGLLNQMKI